MSDALISPAVGGVMWAVTGGAVAYSMGKVKREDLFENGKMPLMGVMSAFIFSAQMLNVSIPGTGSSGHICGALALSATLGPAAAFIAMTIILSIQALFFGDGGLLALGCNAFNIGFLTCFIAYPLIFKPMLNKGVSNRRLAAACLLTAVAGMQMGAFSVVLETLCSGKTELPFAVFMLFMQPIHLAIGIGEGLITSSLLIFLHKSAPESITDLYATRSKGTGIPRKAIAIIAVLTLVCGGVLSGFASSRLDGLEWSVQRVTGSAELTAPSGIYRAISDVQDKTAFFPDYGFKPVSETMETGEQAPWPAMDGSTSAAGIVGSIITLALTGLLGICCRPKRRKQLL